ncbi:MAG: hypothetical protein H6R26_1288 [Proteobacteria bacterium]|nr:hypothetical protein [Pseudomonadota bacterium]
MITIFISAEHTYTWGHYLATSGVRLASEIQFVPYGQKVDVKAIPAGTAIFTDIDRLVLGQKTAAAKIHDRIIRSRPDIRVLNSPSGSLRRYDLLSTLYERGINRFTVYRADQDWKKARLPVFVRIADDHSAPRTQLISQVDDAEGEIQRLRGWERWKRSAKSKPDGDSAPKTPGVKLYDDAAAISLPRDNSLMGVLCRVRRRWHPRNDILVCEFAATADRDGLYHKFGAFVVGQRIIPAHLWYSEHWVVKFSSSRQDAVYLNKEMEYMRTNPHAEQLLKVCALANTSPIRLLPPIGRQVTICSRRSSETHSRASPFHQLSGLARSRGWS